MRPEWSLIWSNFQEVEVSLIFILLFVIKYLFVSLNQNKFLQLQQAVEATPWTIQHFEEKKFIVTQTVTGITLLSLVSLVTN